MAIDGVTEVVRLGPDGVSVENGADDKLPEDLRELWASDAVRAVIEGEDVPALLTERSVRALVGRAQRRDAAHPPPAEGNGSGAIPSVA